MTLLLEDTQGGLRIRDSLDNEHEARAGDLHWTVAGRGIVHGHELGRGAAQWPAVVRQPAGAAEIDAHRQRW
ncbi:hypothetical protein [Achromobacter xylosoxidans]|uniref:hypothetical protein n=1 Tax=Alcaligenes xylosoxydans xylosoxydans TaxID=85698 RepID=UPI001E4BD999|nr:hypothetical protein [Achromobacter xylosoxidans]